MKNKILCWIWKAVMKIGFIYYYVSSYEIHFIDKMHHWQDIIGSRIIVK